MLKYRKLKSRSWKHIIDSFTLFASRYLVMYCINGFYSSILFFTTKDVYMIGWIQY